MEEKDLSEKQREWLEASRKIGRVSMTKTERLLLERLYKEMLPHEQQDLQQFIQDKYGKKPEESGEEKQTEDDPIERMMQKTWSIPSEKFRSALAKTQPSRPPRK
ncbi:hypothetical protein [Desulfomonile tiedjei]|nr:hypothetical protein [Desulfomonile tiedjei]